MLKTGILIGSFFSLMTIVLGAFGAHALKDQLNEYGKSIYEKAVLYQMFHSIAIFVVAILNQFIDSTNLILIVWIFVAGIILFSGSLYMLAITQIKWLGAITPIGGMLFIVGWIFLLYKTFNSNI
tara:strand:- start:368 stop:742 length:375 start_codon:yes stop_codon:yes gene_type:complete